MTSRGQTPHPISTIFNRLLEGAVVDIYTKNQVAASKIVNGRVLTDRQTDTHTHTHRQTDRHTDRRRDGRKDRQTIPEIDVHAVGMDVMNVLLILTL